MLNAQAKIKFQGLLTGWCIPTNTQLEASEKATPRDFTRPASYSVSDLD